MKPHFRLHANESTIDGTYWTCQVEFSNGITHCVKHSGPCIGPRSAIAECLVLMFKVTRRHPVVKSPK